MRALALLLAVDWTRDIQPLFADKCNGCHAAAVTMGSLNLETYDGVLKGGNHGTIVVRGKPGESRLYTMLTGDSEPIMPMGGKLAAPQIAMVGNWIAAGAVGPSKSQHYSLVWMPGGKSLALGGYRKVTFTDGSPDWTGMAEAVRAVVYSADGKTLIAAGGVPGKKGEVMVREGVREGARGGATIAGHSDSIFAAAISPDATLLATASYDKLIKLWDLASGKEIRTLKDHIDAVYALEFTPDGKRLISGAADRTVKVWNSETGERLYTMGEPLDGINSIAVSPDGKRVAAGGLDKTIRIWKLGEKSGELLVSQIAHEDAILKLAFSPDGKRLASTAADRALKIFDSTDLSEIKTLEAQPDWVSGLAYAPDGKRLAVARLDGTFKIYPVE
ncbi:MAG: c-type cytochrome domain-containing protein [Bryobacteraceae bacterium]|nr:c-type cytochrome domain-containing protein [Bryobacteraceae bacterium]